ncbi:hypothetical protein V6N12_041992 [Hibiscus sabdariffa]|uniref:Uncharacterized protein n=1 Tax=Hibiscus sabdariffa TaxID=183260 RepID=A0ABR2EDH1_9ROSI
MMKGKWGLLWMWLAETEMVKEEQSSGMKAGVMLDGGIKGGSSIWSLDSWISSWHNNGTTTLDMALSRVVSLWRVGFDVGFNSDR